MNIICLIGIHQYLYMINSYIALLIYINGVLCHSFIKTKYGIYIRFYDIITNSFLINYITPTNILNETRSFKIGILKYWDVNALSGMSYFPSSRLPLDQLIKGW